MESDDDMIRYINTYNLKEVVREYKFSMNILENYIIPHPMDNDYDDVNANMILVYQPHLEKEKVIQLFKQKYLTS